MTSKPAVIVVALDIDNVVNVQAPAASATAQIGGVTVSWDPTVLERLRQLGARPGIEIAWLSDWRKSPLSLKHGSQKTSRPQTL